MLKHVVPWAAAAILVSSAALARDLPTNDEECAKLADLTKTVVLSVKGPTAPPALAKMLQDLDGQCAAKQYDEAMTTAEKAIAQAVAE